MNGKKIGTKMAGKLPELIFLWNRYYLNFACSKIDFQNLKTIKNQSKYEKMSKKINKLYQYAPYSPITY